MSNYSENRFVNDKNNAWSIIFNLVGDNKKVLDIGCSSGNFGAELIKQKDCIVDGIEIDKSDVSLAQKKLRHVYQLNIETDDLAIIKDEYDAILMMDVIEHLVNPTDTIRQVAKLLKPTGRLIFSIPNMAHISVRLDLMSGQFAYRKTGLLDNTHLHFYTEEHLQDVLLSAGFEVVKTEATTISYPAQLIDKKLRQMGLSSEPAFMDVIEKTGGNVYQFIGLAKYDPASKKTLRFPSINPHEEHYQEIEKALYDQGEQIANFDKELHERERRIAELEAQIQRIVNTRAYKLARAAKRHYTKLRTHTGKRRKDG